MTLTEQVFRKMGILEISEVANGRYWKINGDVIGKIFSKKYMGSAAQSLPSIDSQWEVTAKWLVPFMRERGIDWFISNRKHYSDETHCNEIFHWQVPLTDEAQLKAGYDVDWIEAEIIENNIAEAACKAFMEVSLD